MSLRQLVVLGSSSQVPTRHRNHNGYLLLWDGEGFLFDPGEGTQRQMTIFGARASQITRICVTHFHGDHCLGLPGILQRISLDGADHPVHVHFPGSGQEFYDRLRHASIYEDKADIRPVPHDTPGVIAATPQWRMLTAPLQHGAPAWGYRIEEPDGWTIDPRLAAEAGLIGEVVGRLKRDGSVMVGDRVIRVDEVSTRRRGRSFAFLMDTRPCEGARQLAQGVDLLVCESTFLQSEADEARNYQHMTAEEAGRLARDAGARRLLLTHFSQRYPMDAPFAAEAGRYHDDVHVAYDGLHLDLPPRESP